MIENKYPVGIVTKKDISRLDFSVIRPNEFKCVYENYIDREISFHTDNLINKSLKVGTWGELCLMFSYKTKAVVKFRNAAANAMLSPHKILMYAQDKKYGRFKKLHKEEIDDMVIYKKAYDASLVVRSIVDFFDAEKHVAPEDIVCYISHQQQRELRWFVKNQKMLQALLNNYYKSALYTGE